MRKKVNGYPYSLVSVASASTVSTNAFIITNFFPVFISVSRRIGTEGTRTMSGAHVARGDAGRSRELASRTRESVGKNSGLSYRFEHSIRVQIGRVFNFRITHVYRRHTYITYYYTMVLYTYIVDGANFVSKPDPSVSRSSVPFSPFSSYITFCNVMYRIYYIRL